MLRPLLLPLVLATLVAAPSAAPAGADGSFFVGFSEDAPKSLGGAAAAPATDLGARAFRVTLLWEPGQTQLTADAIAQLDRAVAGTAGMRLVLAVYANAGSKAPRDAAARDEFCTYTANALARYPSIRDVVVWNEPNESYFWSPQLSGGTSVAPAEYEALLARCWDAVHAARSDANVIGLAVSSTG